MGKKAKKVPEHISAINAAIASEEAWQRGVESLVSLPWIYIDRPDPISVLDLWDHAIMLAERAGEDHLVQDLRNRQRNIIAKEATFWVERLEHYS